MKNLTILVALFLSATLNSFAASSTNASRVINIVSGLDQTLSPLSYGAVGNGSIDDTAAFQRVIDAAIISGRKVVLGTNIYKITDTIVVTNGCIIEGNCPVLYGLGAIPNFTNIIFTGNTNLFYQKQGAIISGFEARNISVVGPGRTGAANNSMFINFINDGGGSVPNQNIWIKDCVVQNFGVGVWWSNTATSGINGGWFNYMDTAFHQDGTADFCNTLYRFNVFDATNSIYITGGFLNLDNTEMISHKHGIYAPHNATYPYITANNCNIEQWENDLTNHAIDLSCFATSSKTKLTLKNTRVYGAGGTNHGYVTPFAISNVNLIIEHCMINMWDTNNIFVRKKGYYDTVQMDTQPLCVTNVPFGVVEHPVPYTPDAIVTTPTTYLNESYPYYAPPVVIKHGWTYPGGTISLGADWQAATLTLNYQKDGFIAFPRYGDTDYDLGMMHSYSIAGANHLYIGGTGFAGLAWAGATDIWFKTTANETADAGAAAAARWHIDRNGNLLSVNGSSITISTNATCPTPILGSVFVWNSNSVLYAVSETKTNLLLDVR